MNSTYTNQIKKIFKKYGTCMKSVFLTGLVVVRAPKKQQKPLEKWLRREVKRQFASSKACVEQSSTPKPKIAPKKVIVAGNAQPNKPLIQVYSARDKI